MVHVDVGTYRSMLFYQPATFVPKPLLRPSYPLARLVSERYCSLVLAYAQFVGTLHLFVLFGHPGLDRSMWGSNTDEFCQGLFSLMLTAN